MGQVNACVRPSVRQPARSPVAERERRQLASPLKTTPTIGMRAWSCPPEFRRGQCASHYGWVVQSKDKGCPFMRREIWELGFLATSFGRRPSYLRWCTLPCTSQRPRPTHRCIPLFRLALREAQTQAGEHASNAGTHACKHANTYACKPSSTEAHKHTQASKQAGKQESERASTQASKQASNHAAISAVKFSTPGTLARSEKCVPCHWSRCGRSSEHPCSWISCWTSWRGYRASALFAAAPHPSILPK